MQHQLTLGSLFDGIGNSLAIPCALRILDGIAEVWKESKQ